MIEMHPIHFGRPTCRTAGGYRSMFLDLQLNQTSYCCIFNYRINHPSLQALDTVVKSCHRMLPRWRRTSESDKHVYYKCQSLLACHFFFYWRGEEENSDFQVLPTCVAFYSQLSERFLNLYVLKTSQYATLSCTKPQQENMSETVNHLQLCSLVKYTCRPLDFTQFQFNRQCKCPLTASAPSTVPSGNYDTQACKRGRTLLLIQQSSLTNLIIVALST